MHLTTKQRQIMSCVISGNNECKGVLVDWLTIAELVEILPYKTSRESMQFSIRALIKKELIEKGKQELRDGRWRTPIIPTTLGLEIAQTLRPVDFVGSLDDEEDFIFEDF